MNKDYNLPTNLGHELQQRVLFTWEDPTRRQFESVRVNGT